ncbi:MAG: type II secretion system protein GspN [Desulfobacteraceae bacterium]|nr:MAG: type II secretion system protein GspN [Desulfobacteraceae bacterium]
MKRTVTKRALGYFLWGLVFAGVLIVWKFPYQSLQERLVAIASAQLGVKFEITDMSPSFPFGLKLAKCAVRTMEPESKPFFEANQVRLRFKVLPLLRVRLAFTLRSQAYGGTLSGDVRLTPFYDVRNYQLRVRGQKIQLEGQSSVSTLLGRQVSGKISGDINLEGPLGDLVNASGGGELKLEEGSCPIDSAYLRTRTLEGLEVSATIELSGGSLEITECEFKGQGFQGTVSGKVMLQPRLAGSTLNLAGEGQLDGDMVNLPADKRRVAAAFLNRGKPLPFKVRGTVAEPEFRLF